MTGPFETPTGYHGSPNSGFFRDGTGEPWVSLETASASVTEAIVGPMVERTLDVFERHGVIGRDPAAQPAGALADAVLRGLAEEPAAGRSLTAIDVFERCVDLIERAPEADRRRISAALAAFFG